MDARTAYVWTWLPGATSPVVAGRLDAGPGDVTFTYARSYLTSPEAISLYEPDLPLTPGRDHPVAGELAGVLADAGPDAWGRRIIEHRLTVRSGRPGSPPERDALTHLLESGSDRIGALDFQASPGAYRARIPTEATLNEMAQAADLVERGEPLTPALDAALLHGSSVGGARPKALLVDGDRQLIAKFSSTSDHYPVVKAEFVAMRLAAAVGLDVARVELTRALGRDVLLVERFDRPGDGSRRSVVSALTVLGLDELGGRYASYVDLADVVRARFRDAPATLRELFGRIVFNVLCGNTDDHARNHAAFWDGSTLTLTPAYDLCPQARAGGEAAQAMAITRTGDRLSRLSTCLDAADVYGLSRDEASTIAEHQVDVIRANWDTECAAAALTTLDRSRLWARQFLNPFAFQDP